MFKVQDLDFKQTLAHLDKIVNCLCSNRFIFTSFNYSLHIFRSHPFQHKNNREIVEKIYIS
jgi:hypothetical protein